MSLFGGHSYHSVLSAGHVSDTVIEINLGFPF